MSKHKYTDRIANYLKERKYTIVKGDVMEEFEYKASQLFGNKYGISTCNGTSSLFLAITVLKTLNDSKNEIILANYGFHSDSALICAAGLKPVFCDIDPNTFTIDLEECEKLINEKTLAVLVLQPWGNIANLDEVKNIRSKYKVAFISDSSHAHGATWKDSPIGSYFDINCASFGMGKLVSGGELGILTTDNEEFRDLALLYSHTNRVPSDLLTDKYKNITNSVGIKFRPHLFALLIALDELETYPNRLKIILSNIERVKSASENNKSLSFVKSYNSAERVFWKFEVILEKDINIQNLIANLQENQILCENHNYRRPLSENPVMTDYYKFKTNMPFPNTEKVTSLNILQIPFTVFESQERTDVLINILNNFRS